MLFWILLAAVITIPAVTFVREWREWDFGMGVGAALIAGVITPIAAGVILLLSGGLIAGLEVKPTSVDVREATVQLRATATGDTIEGRAFLGSGTIKEEQVFTYTYQEDGWTRLARVPAEDSRVAEDAEPDSAYLHTTVREEHVWWWAPWPHRSATTHDFHIPPGSVVETHVIDPD